MDIRKFFGKASGGNKQPVTQSGNKSNATNTNKEKEANVKSKLSNFKRERKEEPSKKSSKKSDLNKVSKKTDSKRAASKSHGGSEDEIVINASSDDDDDLVCSTPTNKSRNSYKKNLATSAESKSKDRSSNKTSKEKSSDDKTKTKTDVKQKKDEKSNRHPEKEKPKLEKEASEERRRSPRKNNSVSENKKKESVTSQKKKQRQISDDDEIDDISVIKDSGSDDDDEAFTSKKRNGQKRKRGRKATKVLDDSDSDGEDPLPKKTPQGKKKKKSGVTFIDESDEEKVETLMDKFVKKSTTPAKVEETKKAAPQKSQVNVSDFFGTGSVSASRVERPKPVEKRKRDEAMTKAESEIIFEEELHDDESFMQVLDELDGPNLKKVKLSQPEKKEATSPIKEGSLASKLANKMKAKSSESKLEESDVNGNNKSPSPNKKKSPQKTTTLKQRKSYTLEVTSETKYTKTTELVDAKAEEKTPQKTPQKTSPKPKPQSSSKKDNDKEDDGFNLKKASSFRAFKMRGGPQSLGSKEMPEGEENCLEGCTFVITGVLDCIERDDAKSLVEKYGGKVTTSISKKTSYVVVGREPGESKLSKAKTLNVSQIDEDGLFELIRTLPGKTSKYEIQAKEQLKKEESLKGQKEKVASLKKLESFQSEKEKSSSSKSLFTQLKNSEEKGEDKPSAPSKAEVGQAESLLWVDKHKPSTLKQIIGQQGDKSNANKLLHWIRHWHQNVIVKGLKAAGNFFGKGGGDGTGFRAALLSGPPGIGKTTTATLVCKEAGFSYIELNASDTRSKRSLKEVVSESVNNRTLVDYMGEEKRSGHEHSQHHCLIMDEVDGMAGNEDRGGLQELVQLIKGTKIPIICICNDRNSIKMRTLANYCFDLRFQRPRVEQIKGAMMTLAFREGLKIPAPAVQEIILASNHDIRQVIHNLSMWSAADKNMTFEQVKADAQKAQKDLKLGPFDVCRKVFVSDEETRKMSIHDKSDLFFHDYSFGPLFVHENYPSVIPQLAEGNKCKHMACLARTIDSLCDGDLVEKRIRNGGSWSLLPLQAMFSSVIPGEIMRGSFPQMTNFPSWLGKNSSTGKTDRLLQELGMHMALKISCDKRGLNQDYLPALRMSLTAPLAKHGVDGVPGVIQMMDDYDIVKDDFDNVLEVSKWPNSIDYMARVEPKTKAALTRMYNKSGIMTPYSMGTGGKKKRGRSATVEEEDGLLKEEGEEDIVVASEEEEEDDEPAVVSKPKAKSGKPAAKGKAEASKAKGKGGGGKMSK